ncbi:MAG: hypothetical protein AB2417_15085 [Clostridiaceae bacterium]
MLNEKYIELFVNVIKRKMEDTGETKENIIKKYAKLEIEDKEKILERI